MEEFASKNLDFESGIEIIKAEESLKERFVTALFTSLWFKYENGDELAFNYVNTCALELGMKEGTSYLYKLVYNFNKQTQEEIIKELYSNFEKLKVLNLNSKYRFLQYLVKMYNLHGQMSPNDMERVMIFLKRIGLTDDEIMFFEKYRNFLKQNKIV